MPRLLPCILVAGIVGAMACSDGATAPTTPTEVGTYQLVRIEGISLPAPFPAAGPLGTATATSGTLVLMGTRQWSVEVTYAITAGAGSGAPINRIVSGTYTRSHDAISMRAEDGTIVAAVLIGRRLTALADGVSYDFDRR